MVLCAAIGACVSIGHTPSPTAKPAVAADLIMHNGAFWTGNRETPSAQALAALNGRIVAIGSNADALRLAGPNTQILDLQGRRAIPGFVESHAHLIYGGANQLRSQMGDPRSADELGEQLRRSAVGLPAGTWLVDGRWDHSLWDPPELPNRQLLDRYVPHHPVIIKRIDGHIAVANSLALRRAGITAATPSPPGGQIDSDPKTGEPTGILRETAMDAVFERAPPPTPEQIMQRVRAAQEHAASVGVTSFHDMGTTDDTLAAYQALRRRGELTLRLTVYPSVKDQEQWAEVGVSRGFGDNLLRLGGVKAFSDGSLGASTALLLEPYTHAPHTRGLAVVDLQPRGAYDTAIGRATQQGLQLATHAIGDAANRLVLDAYARVLGDTAHRLRPRIEHAQHLHPQDILRFAKLGVVASMQPYHAIDDGRWACERIGPERSQTTYAFRDLLDSGATVAFGSDWPVAPLSPLVGLYAATTRATLDGERPGGWIPEQKITVEEALSAYTAGGAHAGFAEDEVGSLAVGKLADVVVLDRDLLAVPPEQLRDLKVVLTIVGARIVFADLPREEMAHGPLPNSSGNRSGELPRVEPAGGI